MALGKVQSGLGRSAPSQQHQGTTSMKPTRLLLGCAAVALIAIAALAYSLWPRAAWTNEEVATLRSLWIGSLPPLPADASNKYADDPRAAMLGRQLFFDKRLSVNGKVACASCHMPQLSFEDGKPL